MLLPNVELAAALQVAEALRSACETLAIAHPGAAVAPVVTLSLGVAVHRPTDASPEAMRTLVEDADAALYRAKHEGRNRVCAHVAAPAPAPATPSPAPATP
jgi:diguanylate cyclase (GGDEF)-like protein